MTLITIILAMLLERVLSYSPQWRAHNLTGLWMQWVDARLSPQAWSLAIYLLLPVAGVVAIEFLIRQQPGGHIWMFPLSLLVLIACLGPRELGVEISRYQKAMAEGRSDEAQAIRDDLIAGPGRSGGDSDGRSLIAACFVQGHERWLAVLLWFFLLGLPGAIAYRVLSAISSHLRQAQREGDQRRLCETLHGAMAWPTAHISAGLFALAGSADHAWEQWRRWWQEKDQPWSIQAWSLLSDIGLAALAQDPASPEQELSCLTRALALVQRSLLLFLAIVALLTIGGWIA